MSAGSSGSPTPPRPPNCACERRRSIRAAMIPSCRRLKPRHDRPMQPLTVMSASIATASSAAIGCGAERLRNRGQTADGDFAAIIDRKAARAILSASSKGRPSGAAFLFLPPDPEARQIRTRWRRTPVSSAIVPVYARADVAFDRGEGAWLISTTGERYLDFGAGIAVASLGYSHPHLVETLTTQGAKLWH